MVPECVAANCNYLAVNCTGRRKQAAFAPMFLMSVLVLAFFAAAQSTSDPTDVSQLKQIAFWSTSYAVHHASNAESGIPLRDSSGKELGPVLSKKDWCSAALEGTVRVGGRTYNFARNVKTDHVDCSEYFKPDVGYSRFALAIGPYGDGAAGYVLVPYRTIAADPEFLKLGTALFIPSAVGQILPDGTKHDGYFFVADTGGAIKGDHVDVFQGDRVLPFSFIHSQSSPLITGYVVTDPKIVERLKALHKYPLK